MRACVSAWLRVFTVIVFQTELDNIYVCFCLPVLLTVSVSALCLCMSSYWFVYT